ncbi:hypothetical protein C5167_035637 [Papaver somniferum]|uniref:Cytochrome P450 n=1 Tax=Papaver somniferum TaxID=3469 RepID=A0A4Y7KIP1_PAPSO|nr:hypothetical protein C5167_035637 [Papaver somniferum]
MDFFIFFLSSILIILLLPILSFKFLITSKTTNTRNASDGKIPLGSTGWPIIGEGLALLKCSQIGIPEKFFFDRIIKYSSQIFTTSFLGEKFVCFCGATSNKFLFSNHSKYVEFSMPSTMGMIFPFTDLEKSEQVRKMILSLELKKLVGIIDSITRKHFEVSWDSKKDNEVITVYPLAKKHSFTIACKVFLSIDDPAKINELLKKFIPIVNGFFSLQINFPGTGLNRAIKASRVIRKEIMSIVHKRKNNNLQQPANNIHEQDVLSHMIRDNDNDNADAKNDDVETMADKMVAMLTAAYDTNSVVITNITKYLAELPEIYDAVRIEQINIAKAKGPGELLNLADIQNMKYSWERGLIFHSKGKKDMLECSVDTQDPEYFTNPEKFDPSRFKGSGPAPYTFVPFGGGPHTCPGKEYAKLTILVFMHHLVTRYKWRNLFSSPDDVGKLIFNLYPLPRNGLPILLQPHADDIKS